MIRMENVVTKAMDDYNEEQKSEGWPDYRRVVLSTLQDLKDSINILNKNIANLHSSFNERLNILEIEIAVLKTKAAVWGALAGFIVTTVLTAGDMLFHIRH